jgi:hypothetical protein
LITPFYLELQDKISKARSDVQSKEGVLEKDVNAAEERYEKEVKTFKQLFGKTTLADIDWDANTQDWPEILLARWKEQHSA